MRVDDSSCYTKTTLTNETSRLTDKALRSFVEHFVQLQESDLLLCRCRKPDVLDPHTPPTSLTPPYTLTNSFTHAHTPTHTHITFNRGLQHYSHSGFKMIPRVDQPSPQPKDSIQHPLSGYKPLAINHN